MIRFFFKYIIIGALFVSFRQTLMACEFRGETGVDESLQQVEAISEKIPVTETKRTEFNLSYDSFTVENGVITFTYPKFNDRYLKYSYLKCIETKENMFGVEVCSQYAKQYTAYDFCREIGLDTSPSSKFGRIDKNAAPVYLTRSGDEWRIARTHSFLTNGYSIKVIAEVSCAFNPREETPRR